MQHYKSILSFLLIILISSCTENNEIIYMKKINANISIFLTSLSVTSYSNDNYIENILSSKNTGFWLSNGSGKDEVIFFEFNDKRYIKKLLISNEDVINFDSISKVIIYTDKGKLCSSGINEPISINDTIQKIFIKIISTNNFKFVSGYKDDISYKLDLQNKNKVAINKIFFFGADNQIIPIYTSRCLHKKNKSISLPKYTSHKFIDYTTSQKSIILNPDFSFYATRVEGDNDFIYKGKWTIIENTSHKTILELNGQKYIFTNNSFQEKEFSDKVIIQNNSFDSQELGTIYTDLPDDALVEITDLDSTIVLDIKYATADNFTGKILYDCTKCLIRYAVAKDLIIASNLFQKDGFRIKIFDAYRPNSVQYLMWEVVPNINYVANPEKGSIHNRGGAIDLTLVDATGKELDMGTEFDYFGIKAFSDYTEHSDTILNNRFYMRNILSQCNFRGIRTEWWHYSHRKCMLYKILDFPLPCED